MLGYACLALVLAGCGTPAAELDVVLTDFAYSPALYSVFAGSRVSLTLRNQGAVAHNWIIMQPGSRVSPPFDEDDEADVIWRAHLDARATETFTFDAPEAAGEYPIVCSEPGHFEAGMVGRLVVVP